MAKLLSFVIFVIVVVAINASGCTPEATKDVIRNQTTGHESKVDIRYSIEVYYQLLLYIKENNLVNLDDDCPKCRCFSDGTCIDLCDSGIWP